ncbi:MAG: 50S ribosomal protein L16 [Kiritimatiellae bacterium]|nr:50S ribosomal protein L16 [Kiritimatiellia bacterium]MBO7299342.1 50S ribosomal protein L16 [Kiritimatiellia bacterium]MBQ2281409.1 50S ribosomal protein L16 [Kiritimatiellia bacterium]
MPLMPKRVKHRKVQRGSRSGIATSNTQLAQGDYGLKTLERAWITNIQIEACRVAINRHLKRRGQLWIRIYPDKPVSKKPIEVRMGKGKGNPEFWVAVVLPGHVMFELAGVPDGLAREAMRLAAAKLGVRTVLIRRDGTEL